MKLHKNNEVNKIHWELENKRNRNEQINEKQMALNDYHQ